MFQFPRFPLSSLCVQQESTQAFPWVGFPIRASTDQCLTTTSRGLSQLSTPFIGSWRQGIHRWLFVAWKNKDARACSAVLKGHRRRRVRALHAHQTRRGSGAQCARAVREGSAEWPAPSKRKRRLDLSLRARREANLQPSISHD